MTPPATARWAPLLLWAAAAAFSSTCAHAQGSDAPAAPQPTASLDTPAGLAASLQAMDEQMFEQGFNRCNIPAMAGVLHPELEFFHDIGGTSRHDDFLQSFSTGLCGRADYQSTRKLIPGSMQVYPLKNKGQLYGAVQMGEHEFFETTAGQAPRYGSRARFVHTWLLVEGRWKLYRVLSFDHRVGESR